MKNPSIGIHNRGGEYPWYIECNGETWAKLIEHVNALRMAEVFQDDLNKERNGENEP